MPLKKRVMQFFIIFAVGMIIFLTVLAGLPFIIESQLKKRLPILSKDYPINFEIEKVGISNTYISHIRIAEGVSIDGLNIKYAIKSIFTPQVKKIIVSGLTIHANLDQENQIQILGIDRMGLSTNKPDQKQLPFLPYLPEKLVFKKARIILNIKGQEFLIPLDVLSRIYTEKGRIDIKASAYPFGEKVDCLIGYDIKKGLDRVKIDGKSFDMGHLDQFISKKTDMIRLFGPTDFTLSSSLPQKKWELTVSHVIIEKSLKAQISGIKATILMDNSKLAVTGNFEFSHAKTPKIWVDYDADFDLKGARLFNVNLKTGQLKDFFIKQESNALYLSSPKVSLAFNGGPEKVEGKIKFDCKKGTLTNEKQKIYFDNSKLRLDVFADLIDKNKTIQMDGNFSVPQIKYKDHTFFIHGKIAQTDTRKMNIKGVIGSKTIKQAKLEFNVAVAAEDKLQVTTDFDTQMFKLTDADIKKWVPQKFQSGQFDVSAFAKGRIEWVDNRLKTDIQVGLKNGNLHLPDMKIVASGINTSIQFNDLRVPESVPGQILTIDSVEVNKVKISDAIVRFSIEDAKSILIENTRFKWCKGTVTSEAIRFPQSENNYAMSLYCDRLDLVQVLKQMEISNVKGSGTLNGRIPVAYSDGIISFDNGFLFSSPGNSGKIKIENTEKLTAGIPMDDPAFVQLDLTREALKDFNYKWANLSFNTFDGALYLNISLNGKPENNLPFEPLDTGGFVRVDDSKLGSELEGLQLDVNLNLPFNEVLKFGNKLKSIFN